MLRWSLVSLKYQADDMNSLSSHAVPKPIGLTSVCESLIIHLRLELAAGVRICSLPHDSALARD